MRCTQELPWAFVLFCDGFQVRTALTQEQSGQRCANLHRLLKIRDSVQWLSNERCLYRWWCVNYNCPRRHNSCVIVTCFRCSDVDQGSIVSRSKWNPPKSCVGFFLVQSPLYPGCGVGGGSVERCRLTIVACVVPFFYGLTYYSAHGEVIFGVF